jgi:hypothetical protein
VAGEEPEGGQVVARVGEHRQAPIEGGDLAVATLGGQRVVHGRRAEPLTPPVLTQIISIHVGLLATVQSALRKGQTPRSFVSKYLHFHNPVVPIFDSVAASA